MSADSKNTELISFTDWLKKFGGDSAHTWLTEIDDNPTVKSAIKNRYYNMRNVSSNDTYPVSAKGEEKFHDEKQFAKKAKAQSGNVHCFEENEIWAYRCYNQTAYEKHVTARLSLNVYQYPQLIDKLDEILNDDKGECINQYKMLALPVGIPLGIKILQGAAWEIRNDPVTIYFHKLTPELLKIIVDAVKPFLREEKAKIIPTEENPYGIELPKGMYYHKEYSREEVKQIIEDFGRVAPVFAIEIYNAFEIDKGLNLSVGEVEVILQFQKELKRDIDKIDTDSILRYSNTYLDNALRRRISRLEKDTSIKEVTREEREGKIRDDVAESRQLMKDFVNDIKSSSKAGDNNNNNEKQKSSNNNSTNTELISFTDWLEKFGGEPTHNINHLIEKSIRFGHKGMCVGTALFRYRVNFASKNDNFPDKLSDDIKRKIIDDLYASFPAFAQEALYARKLTDGVHKMDHNFTQEAAHAYEGWDSRDLMALSHFTKELKRDIDKIDKRSIKKYLSEHNSFQLKLASSKVPLTLKQDENFKDISSQQIKDMYQIKE